MKFGYLLDFRNPPGSGLEFAELYAEMFRQIEFVEGAGFDSVWLTEHHFTDDGYMPAIMPASLTLVKQHDGRDKAVADARGGRIGAVALACFATVVTLTATRLAPVWVLATAAVTWVTVAVACWLVVDG